VSAFASDPLFHRSAMDTKPLRAYLRTARFFDKLSGDRRRPIDKPAVPTRGHVIQGACLEPTVKVRCKSESSDFSRGSRGVVFA
jgi:hypothetical protein